MKVRINNKISSLIILILILLSVPGVLYAVPAAPVIHDLNQPDGSTFKARQWGDERSHGWETTEGYTINRDELSKKWFYAIKNSQGKVAASTLVVGDDKSKGRSIRNFKKHLRPKTLSRAQVAGIAETPLSSPIVMAAPATSSANIPVILINYNNTSTSFTASDFENLLFAIGNNSMKDYYEEVSYGAFTVSSGPGGIAGWYTASKSHNYYGQNDIYGYDKWPGKLVTEAIEAADPVFDFAPYDQDGDCYVDVIDIIHQGSGEEAGGPSTDIWSHRWNLNSAFVFGYGGSGEVTTDDTCPGGGFIKINDYVIQPETLWGGIQTVGVFAHEYGHALGLPDLYDTDNSSEGIGSWGLMASGSWNGITQLGDSPAHMSAWSKIDLGWVTPVQVTGMLVDEPVNEASASSDVYQLLSGDQHFLVENRNRTGFDSGLPGSGLIIWHIDNVQQNNNLECYPPDNCLTIHYKVSIEQADNQWHLEKNINRGDTGDPFHSAAGYTEFSDISTPNSNLYGDVPSNVYIADISTSGTDMTATLSVSGECADSDGDDYGSPGYSLCPAGVQTDCDDTDGSVNPGAAEVTYNGKDDDCNPTTLDDDLDSDTYPIATDCDDNDPNINPLTYWYPDSDGDGFGNPTISIQQCDQPFDYVLDNSDCDDNDANIYPGGPPLRTAGSTPVYFNTMQEAYNSALDGDAIQCQAVLFEETLNINLNKSVTFDGGYNCGFTANTDKSFYNGTTTISDGVLTIGNFIY